MANKQNCLLPHVTCYDGKQKQSPSHTTPDSLSTILIMLRTQLTETDGITHAGHHTHGGVGQDVQEEKHPEHRGVKH